MKALGDFPVPWTTAGQATRPCFGNYYIHPLSDADLRYQAATGMVVQPVYYDNSGHCIPAPDTPVVGVQASSGPSIWTILIIAGGIFLIWHYRKEIKHAIFK